MLLSAPAAHRAVAALGLLTVLAGCSKSSAGPVRPDAPTGLTASASGPRSVQLDWSLVGSGEAGVRVERRTGTAPALTVAELPEGTTSWADSGLTPSTRYVYRVRSFNSAGVSWPSNEVAVSTFEGDPPEFVLAFPPPEPLVCATDRDRIAVFGTVTDGTGVRSVTINDIPAVALPDGTWRADVPLTLGDNPLVVATTDTLGNAGERSPTTVRREDPMVMAPRDGAFDPTRNRVVFTDPASRALLAVNRTTGSVSTISSPAVGSGPPFGRPAEMTVDEPLRPRRALVADRHEVVLFEVDLATGARRVAVETGPSARVRYSGSGGLSWDGGPLAWAIGQLWEPRILEVDVAAGSLREVSSSHVGSGPQLLIPRGLSRLDGSTLLVTDVRARALFTIDRSTGNRRIISSDSVGTGPALGYPVDVAADPRRNVAFVSDPILAAVLSIDLATGNRTIVSDPATGSGPPMPSPGGIDYDPVLDRLVVTDPVSDCVLLVDPVYGVRSAVYSPRIGEGEGLWAVRTRDLAAHGARVFVPDLTGRRVLAIGLSTGQRTVLTGPRRGNGPALEGPRAITVDPASGTLFVGENLTDVARVMSIDPENGDRSIVSDDTHMIGANLSSVDHVAFLEGEAAVLAAGTDFASGRPVLLRIDLSSGIRRVVSGAGRGAGDELVPAEGLALDPVHGRALVVSSLGYGSLLAVDLASGDRSVVASAMRGRGPDLVGCDDVVVDSGGRWALTRLRANGAIVRIDLSTGDRTYVRDAFAQLGPMPTADWWNGIALLRDRTVLLVDPLSEPPGEVSGDRWTRSALYALDVETGETVVIAR